MKPRLSIVVAMDRNGLIGKDNQLPWRLPADLKHFKKITMGKPIILGRKTFESIGRALPGRANIVVTRDPGYRAPGCKIACSLDDAIVAAGAVDEVIIIGGAELYRQSLDRVHRIYLTRVDAELDGDAWFPSFDGSMWTATAEVSHDADADNPFAYVFQTLNRVRN